MDEIIQQIETRMTEQYEYFRSGRLQAGRDLAYARFDELAQVLEILTGTPAADWRAKYEPNPWRQPRN